MTPSELLRDLPVGPGDERANKLFWRIALRFLADHVHDAELPNRMPVRDVTDFDMWLRELAAGLQESTPVEFGNHKLRASGRVIDSTCPRCGHIHEGSSACGAQMGGGGICPCEMEVSA